MSILISSSKAFMSTLGLLFLLVKAWVFFAWEDRKPACIKTSKDGLDSPVIVYIQHVYISYYPVLLTDYYKY